MLLVRQDGAAKWCNIRRSYILKRIELVSKAAMKFERKSRALGFCQMKFNGMIGLSTWDSTHRNRGTVVAKVPKDTKTRGCVPMTMVSTRLSRSLFKHT